jgi:gluconokinase
MIVVIMGVAGSGKTTVGELLASKLHFRFLDGDSLHPPGNIEKMTHDIPLTDADRAPWLAAVHSQIVESFRHGEHLVIACSALKQRYRDTLEGGVTITWVYLKGSYALIREHLQHRQHHFMKPEMLASQFADLEEPADAIVIEVAAEPAVAVSQIVSALPAAPRIAS